MRQRVSRIVTIGCGLLVAATVSIAEMNPAGSPVPGVPRQASPDLPDAASIFERHIEAIGGRDKVFSITNRRITGTYTGTPFEFRANVRIWWESDGRFHQRVSEPAGLRFDFHVNGDYTWATWQDGEPVALGGLQRLELLDTADFYGEANYENRYKSIETVGSARADGRPIYVVQAVTHADRPHRLFFDQETGLLVGTQVPAMTDGGRIREMTLRISDYKDFGGVLYPTRMHQQVAGIDSRNVYHFTAISVNADEPHDYEVPEKIKREWDEARARAAQENAAEEQAPVSDEDD